MEILTVNFYGYDSAEMMHIAEIIRNHLFLGDQSLDVFISFDFCQLGTKVYSIVMLQSFWNYLRLHILFAVISNPVAGVVSVRKSYIGA